MKAGVDGIAFLIGFSFHLWLYWRLFAFTSGGGSAGIRSNRRNLYPPARNESATQSSVIPFPNILNSETPNRLRIYKDLCGRLDVALIGSPFFRPRPTTRIY
jgi:hypothetical protein